MKPILFLVNVKSSAAINLIRKTIGYYYAAFKNRYSNSHLYYAVFIPLVLVTTITNIEAQGTEGIFDNDLTTLLPNDALGAVDQREIDLFDNYYLKNVVPNMPKDNNKKDITWDVAPIVNALVLMYETTGDEKYIKYAEDCCDAILKAKKTDWIDYPTGRIIKGWPYYYFQFTQGKERIKSLEKSKSMSYIPAVYNSVVNNGCIIRALSMVSRVIKRDNLSQNHQDKAQQYIDSCIETIHSFIDHDDWYNKENKMFRFPKTKEHENCLDRCGGLITAHNRQLIFAVAMLNVKKYYEFKGERDDLQARYESIVISVSQYFWESAIRKKKNGAYFYTWNYKEEKKIGSKRLPSIEDIGHGGLDIQCVTQIYNDLGSISLSYNKRKFGKDNFFYLSNTLLNLMYKEENENFSKRIDGTFDKPKFMKKKKYNSASIRWISLCDWDERVFTNAHKQLINKMSIKSSRTYCEFLYYKEKRFGNTLSTK